MADPKAELVSLQQVRCFSATAELGSFTAAAERLRVSQPAVAEQVRKLERALGADLSARAGRGVALTQAGRAFADHALRTLEALDAAVDSVGELTSMRSGTLTIGTFSAPSAWRFDELAAGFLGRHPGMRLRLVGRSRTWRPTCAPSQRSSTASGHDPRRARRVIAVASSHGRPDGVGIATRALVIHRSRDICGEHCQIARRC